MLYGGGDDLAGRRLRVAHEFLHRNPRRPNTHGWVAFEVLRRAPGGTMKFEQYAEALFDPTPEIMELARSVRGVPNAFQDLKHIRCDIYRQAVLVEPQLDESWFRINRCSPGSKPH